MNNYLGQFLPSCDLTLTTVITLKLNVYFPLLFQYLFSSLSSFKLPLKLVIFDK